MRIAVIAAVAVCIVPSAAFGQDTSNQPEWIEQAKIVAKMQGVSVGEAVRRFRLQQKVAELDRRFQSDPDYAGAWIDQKGARFRATFAFKGGSKDRRIDDTELAAESDITTVAQSMQEIQLERQRLAKLLKDANQSATFSIQPQLQRLEATAEGLGSMEALPTEFIAATRYMMA